MYQDINQKKLPDISLKEQWGNVLKKLNAEYGNEVFNSWIKNISIRHLEEDTIHFTVPSRFTRDWITSHYLDKIIYFLNNENSEIRRVKINIDNSLSATALKREILSISAL